MKNTVDNEMDQGDVTENDEGEAHFKPSFKTKYCGSFVKGNASLPVTDEDMEKIRKDYFNKQ